MKRISRRSALRRAMLALVLAPHLGSTHAHNRKDRLALEHSKNPGRPALTLLDIWPDRASYRPGEPAALHAAIANHEAHASSMRLDLHLSWLDQPIGTASHEATLPPGETTLAIPWTALPRDTFRGYGVEAILHDEHGTLLARAGTAFDVLEDWTAAPRYGFLSDFAPGDPFAAGNVAVLARYHINVVQFYDWMWRHYELMPPHEVFADALGRELSLHTVREKVRACHTHGMAALGYAAVYGAEPDYALAHPGEMLYDAGGEPYSLEKLFYIMNIHRGNPWRTRMLHEMARAVREVPFDGLHLDQYGFPKDQAFGPGPHPVAYDLAQDFPPFIDDARRAVRAARSGMRVIFNAVDNWPIETVAPTSQDATYIEVWPPYDAYSDLQTLILEARRLAPEKQVILAAYLKPLLGAVDSALPPAEAATRLASAAIWANGGFHLLLGERDAALCDPYYPKYATMMPPFARVMRRLYDFVVRYENVLSDRRLATATGSDGLRAVQLSGVAGTPFAQPGQVWTIARAMPGLHTVSLINLTAAREASWNVAQPAPAPLHDLELEIAVDGPIEAVFAASPDQDEISPHPLPFSVSGQGATTRIRLRLPRLEYWSLIVARTPERS